MGKCMIDLRKFVATNSVLLQTLIKSPILVLFIYGSYLETETEGYQAEYAHLSSHFF